MDRNSITVSTLCVLLTALTVSLSSYNVTCQVSSGVERSQRLVSVKQEKRPLGEVIKLLMKEYGFKIGFEESTLDRGHDDYRFPTLPPSVSKQPQQEIASGIYVSAVAEWGFTAEKHYITLNVKEKDMGFVMDQIVSQLKYYSWSYSDGVYNITPKVGRDDRYANLLGQRVKSFRVDAGVPVGQIQYEIYRLPEVASFLAVTGLKPTRLRTTVSIEQLKKPIEERIEGAGLTLIELLNQIVRNRGGGWALRQGRTLIVNKQEYIEIDI